MPDQAPLTLGESLAAPMERVNPSPLPWTVASYRLQYGTGDNFSAAHATLVSDPQRGEERWRAFCAGPGNTKMPKADFPTAEEARAAVEEHYFAHVDTGLSEESE